MTKQEPNVRGEDRWTHKGWEVILRERPEGLLFCLFPPDADCAICTTSLKNATQYINACILQKEIQDVVAKYGR